METKYGFYMNYDGEEWYTEGFEPVYEEGEFNE